MFALGLLVATLLNNGTLSGKPVASAEQAPGLFDLQTQSYDAKDLSYAAADALYKLEQEHFERKTDLLQRAALYIHLDNLAAKRGVSRDAIRNELIPAQPVGEAEAVSFYEKNQQRITKPYHEVKEAIVSVLQRNRVEQANQQLIDDLLQTGQLTFNIEPPKAPAVNLETDGFAALGPESAPVVVAEFADYKCPHCKTASKTLVEIQKEYPEKVRLIIMELPILGKTSEYAAKAAICAQQQNAYWPLHEAMFASQSGLTISKINELAGNLQIDTAALETCIGAPDSDLLTASSLTQAQNLGLKSTPAIFINGIAYRGHNHEASLRDAVVEAISVTTNSEFH